MIRTAQRRFAPTVIGITRNSDRHQFGMSDRLRRNPQLSLTRQNVDSDNLVLRVYGKGNKQCLVPISLELRKVLYLYLAKHCKIKELCQNGNTLHL
jgi:site-specific recombinase XerC